MFLLISGIISVDEASNPLLLLSIAKHIFISKFGLLCKLILPQDITILFKYTHLNTCSNPDPLTRKAMRLWQSYVIS